MNGFCGLSHDDILELHSQLLKEYDALKAKGLKLDMSRGRPCAEQLSLSNALLNLPVPEDLATTGDVEARTYGELAGLYQSRKFFAELLGVDAEEVFVGGNSSLNLMYDIISKAYTHGLLKSVTPWCKLDKVKFLCPAPGYDRHFAISESFGMELITIDMTQHGPDMDAVEAYVKDPAVKGIWCVPKFSNPTGAVYSDKVINRFARLKPAAEDFIIMWDNAYAIHEIEGEFKPLPDIISLCRAAGNPHMVFEFTSTSKITFPGSGVAAFACSRENLEHMRKLYSIQTIGYDKLNQLRHVLFLKDMAHTLEHMKQHAKYLKQRFDIVQAHLDRELKPCGLVDYEMPKGGYFISVRLPAGCARKVCLLAQAAGVMLTKAGACFPYGVDPLDSQLRLAPSNLSLEDLELAMQVFCVCVKLAALEAAQNKFDQHVWRGLKTADCCSSSI